MAVWKFRDMDGKLWCHQVLFPCLLIWISSNPMFRTWRSHGFGGSLDRYGIMPSPGRPWFAHHSCRSLILDIGKHVSRAAWHRRRECHAAYGSNHGDITLMVVSIVVGGTQTGWFTMENPLKMDDLGGTPILGNHHIASQPNFEMERRNSNTNRQTRVQSYPKVRSSRSMVHFRKVDDIHLTQRNALWCITILGKVYDIWEIAMVPSSSADGGWKAWVAGMLHRQPAKFICLLPTH